MASSNPWCSTKDIDIDNILINFKGGPRQDVVAYSGGNPGPPSPFRAYFPVRYYLNDFELAVCYEHDSDPSTRVVSGLPTKGLHGKYGRAVVPEMLSEEPYCPFRADVWQLGKMFLRCFQVSLDTLSLTVDSTLPSISMSRGRH
jgi:hypothetical protein